MFAQGNSMIELSSPFRRISRSSFAARNIIIALLQRAASVFICSISLLLLCVHVVRFVDVGIFILWKENPKPFFVRPYLLVCLRFSSPKEYVCKASHVSFLEASACPKA